jgi:predicted Zn-dependent protease
LKVELARLLMLLLHQDEADAILYKLLDSAPQNIEARAMLVQSLLATNRVPQAIAFLRSVTAVPSPNPGEGLALANLYLRTNAPDQALETLDRLDAGGRATEQTLLTRASALVAIHHADDARDAYRRALALAPTNPTAVRELIRLDIAANDWNDARTVIRNALRLLPTDPSLLRLRVRIDFLSGGEAAAKATIARLQSDATSRGGAAALYADLDFDAGHYRQAADAYVILAKQTSNGHYIVGAFEAFNAAKQPDLAKSTLRDWLAQHPDDLEVLRVSINLELTNLRYDVAKPLLERALLIAPSDAVTLNNLAFIYDEQHDPRAQSMARRAFQVQPSPQSADTLGWIMVKQGAANQALPLLSYAARAMKSTGVVQLHFATALRDTGDRAQAIAVLSPLATLQPGFAELSVAQKMLHELQAVN